MGGLCPPIHIHIDVILLEIIIMEFRKREVKRKPPPERFKFGPDFSHMKTTIQDEFAKQGRTPKFVDDNPAKDDHPAKMELSKELSNENLPTYNKDLNVIFSCEMFELGDFNQHDVMCPIDSCDKKYEMEKGQRTYTYAIDDDNPSHHIQSIIKHWKEKLTGRKYTFSITSRLTKESV